MKKQIFFGFMLAGFVFMSCSWQIPHSVKVKTNADYYFSLGNVNLGEDLADAISVEKILDGKTPDSNFRLYDYNPNGNSKIVQYLAEMQVQSINIDFSKYFDDSSITSSLSDMSFRQSFKIPNIDLNYKKAVDIEVIKDGVNGLLSITNAATGSDLSLNFNMVAGNSFNTVEYAGGYLDVVVIGDESFDDTKVTLLHSETVVSEGMIKKDQSVTIKGVTYEGLIARLPLANKTIYKDDMSIQFSKGDGAYFSVLVDNGTPRKVTGLDLITQTIPINTSFAVGDASSKIKTCTFGTGSALNIEFKTPESWSGVILNAAMDLSGGMTGSVTSGSNDIAGKKFTNQDIEASCQVTPSISNATIVFADIPEIKLSTIITDLTATVELDNDVNFNIAETYSLPDEALDVIKSITWNKSGVEIKYDTSFPAGNDMPVVIKSEFLDIDDSTSTIVSGTKGSLNYFCSEDRETPLSKAGGSGYSKIDFSAEVQLPGYNKTENTITVSKVVPNTTYEINLTVEPKFDWKFVTIDGSGTSQSGSIDTNVGLGDLIHDLGKELNITDLQNSLELKSIPVYLYCQVPAIGGFEGFAGKIKAYATGSTPDYILGTETEDGNLRKASVPELRKNAKGEVINDITKSTNSFSGDLKEALNHTLANPSSTLKLDYDLTLTGKNGSSDVTISKADLRNSSGSIEIVAYIVLPLDFTVKNTIQIDDLFELSSDDLLGRDSAGSPEDLDVILDIIDSVYLQYNSVSLPFSANLKVKVDFDGAGTNFDEEVYDIKNGIIKVDIRNLLDVYPLIPDVKLEIPNGDLKVNRGASFILDFGVGLKTNGTIDLFEVGA